ncbi:MAG: SDR family NAD(P)-dependent oxidoreductase, partial [Alphaproteobacteria bacterium]
MNRGAAFVVGGTGGLGGIICRRLADEWDGVAIGYRSSADKARAVIDTLRGRQDRAIAVHADLSDMASIQSGFADVKARFGAIGTVIFASGVDIA